jgi:hypothetical protein
MLSGEGSTGQEVLRGEEALLERTWGNGGFDFDGENWGRAGCGEKRGTMGEESTYVIE